MFKFAKNTTGFIFSRHSVEDLYFQLVIGKTAVTALLPMCFAMLTYVSFFTGLCAVEIKTEADSNDVTQCLRDDKPSTAIGMFDLSGVYMYSFICFNITLVPMFHV